MESGLTLGQLLSQEASLDPYQHRLCSKCVKIGGSGLSIMCPVQSSTTSYSPISLLLPFTMSHSVAAVIQWLQSHGQGILWGKRPWLSPFSEAAVLPLTVMGLCLAHSEWNGSVCQPEWVIQHVMTLLTHSSSLFLRGSCSTGVLAARSRQC